MLSKNDFSLFDKVYVIFCFLYANIFISPILSLLPLSAWKSITLLSYVLLFGYFSFRHNIPIDKKMVVIFIIAVILFSVTCMHYLSIKILSMSIGFLMTLGIFFFFDKKYIEPFVSISTVFISIIIVLAWIGFTYALMGGAPLFSIKNPDSRNNYLYLTTFSNAVFGRFIRPGGIYDEPGAFSFFICSICLLRVICKKNDNITFIILMGGIVTTSLAHVVVIVCFVLYYLQRYWKKRKTSLYILYSIVITLVIFSVFYESLNDLLLSRLKYNSQSKTISGDSRSGQIRQTLKWVTPDVFLWGLGPDVYDRANHGNIIRKYGFIQENPFSPIVILGIVSGLFFYVFIGVIFLGGLLSRKYMFIFAAEGLLYFQRPYYSLGYAFYLVLFFGIAILCFKKQSPIK